MSKRVLLTGAGGFIGAHCVKYFLENTDWEILATDSFRHKGTISRLDAALGGVSYNKLDKFKLFKHDLTVPIDKQLENLLLARGIDDRGNITEKPIHYIINMAADSAVERSVTDPTACWRNNCELGINMLEFARKAKPEKYIAVSTDEVYGEYRSLGIGHEEWSTILPSNVYAASKAAQEAAAIAYWRTYDLPVVLTNTQNIIGEWQDPEKFIPKVIQNIAAGKEIPIYADGPDKIGSRFYLHAANKADALIFILKQPVARYSQGADKPDRYNICGGDELNNLEVAQLVAELMGKELKYKLVSSESARPGYDRRYALDNRKLKKLGWTPPLSFRDSLKKMVDWTMLHKEWLT